MLENIIGSIAAIITTVAFLPQAIQTWKTKSTKDISLSSFLMLSAGAFMWLSYGILKKDYPIIFANGVVFCLSSSILLWKLKNR